MFCSFFRKRNSKKKSPLLPEKTVATPSIISAPKAVDIPSIVSAPKAIDMSSLISATKTIIAPSVMAACMLLAAPAPNAHSEEVSVQHLYYNEADDRVTVHEVELSLNKDIGTDNVVHFKYNHDSISGGSPTWVDTASGGSGVLGVVQVVTQPDFEKSYENVPFDDTRNAGDVLWTHRFNNRDEIETGIHVSKENDFLSYGFSAEYALNLNNANTTILFGGSYLKNELSPVSLPDTTDPDPLIPNLFIDDDPTNAHEEFSFINLQTGVTQVLTSTSLVSLNPFIIIERGYLNNPYFRVIRVYTHPGGTQSENLFEENRPNERIAYGVSLKYIEELAKKYTLHVGYRLYSDNWDIVSNTFDIKVYTDLTKKITIIPGFRYYSQSQAYFYGDIFPEKFSTSSSITPAQEFASSDYRLDDFNSWEIDLGVDYKINDKLKFNVTGSRFEQSSGLQAFFISSGLKYSF